jgi:hypothetical protein
VRKPREDRGARRVVSAKIKAVIEGLALERPPLPIRSICRQVRQFAEATGEVPPRYGTVYDLVREIPSGLLTLAQRGSKAYSEEFDLVPQIGQHCTIPVDFAIQLHFPVHPRFVTMHRVSRAQPTTE